MNYFIADDISNEIPLYHIYAVTTGSKRHVIWMQAST